MKKSTVIVTVVLIVIVTALVGYYAFLSGKSRTAAEENAVTPTQLVLNKDLERDYPATPKEVVRFYTEIEKCFYNEDCTDEEIEQLGMKARELYDEELLANNEVGTYLERLKREIKDFKDNKKRLTGANVAASANVDFFSEDGYDFARIYCGYTILDGNGSTSVGQVYLLRRDENRRWKIFGWASSDKVNPGEKQTGE
ncbi:MAG: DUF6715 family protein [Acetatifactor sp.]